MKDENEVRVGAKLAVAELEDLVITADKSAYNQLAELGEHYRSIYAGKSISQIPETKYARTLFKAIGIDPTKRRPSSEALMRRALNNKGFKSVNLLVDIGNWCSLQFLLPVCVYDASQVNGEIEGRIGRPDDGYIAIDNCYLNLHNRYLICDLTGPIGSPIKDSLKTKVTTSTKKAVLLIYAPADFPEDVLLSWLDKFISRVKKYCLGNLIRQYLRYTTINQEIS
jgi:DNA/RNA-binding domain of Phe-tRNA-synthetase-like protein